MINCVEMYLTNIKTRFDSNMKGQAPNIQLANSMKKLMDVARLYCAHIDGNEFGKEFWHELSKITANSPTKFDQAKMNIYPRMKIEMKKTMDNILNKILNVNFDNIHRVRKIHKEKINYFNHIYDNLMFFIRCDDLGLAQDHFDDIKIAKFRETYYQPCLDNICKNIAGVNKVMQAKLDNKELELDEMVVNALNANISILKGVMDSNLIKLLNYKDIESIIVQINAKIDAKLQKIKRQGIKDAENAKALALIGTNISSIVNGESNVIIS